MTTYIAQFTAKHRVIQIEQHSIFIWRQESGDVNEMLLKDKIKRESALLFYGILAGKNYPISEEDISVTIWKSMPFGG